MDTTQEPHMVQLSAQAVILTIDEEVILCCSIVLQRACCSA